MRPARVDGVQGRGGPDPAEQRRSAHRHPEFRGGTVMSDTTETTESLDDVVRGAAGMPEPPAQRAEEPSIDDLEEAMRDVVDPELGINVVDLGLVYGIQAQGGVATIDMTLTSAAC